MSPKHLKILKRWRMKNELKVRLLQFLDEFKSKEEPRIAKVTDQEIVEILGEVLLRKIRS